MLRILGRARPPSTIPVFVRPLSPRIDRLRQAQFVYAKRPLSFWRFRDGNQSYRQGYTNEHSQGYGNGFTYGEGSAANMPPQFRVQPVIFKKPTFGQRAYSALETTTIWLISMYFFMKFSDLWVAYFDGEEEEEDIEEGEDGRVLDGRQSNVYGRADIEGASEGDELGDDEALFIPLGYPKLMPGEYYAGTDPEWLKFAEVAQNAETLQATKEDLVKLVQGAASRNPALHRLLGDPVTLMSFWIMHEFPYRAPPEYYRSGLEIGPDYIGWVSRPVTNEEAQKIIKMYSLDGLKEPLALAWRVILGQGLNKVSRALGHEEWPSDNQKPGTTNSLSVKGHPGSPSAQSDNFQEPQTTAQQQQQHQHPPPTSSVLRNPFNRDYHAHTDSSTGPGHAPSTFPSRRLLDAADPDFDIGEATAAYRRMASKAKSKFVIPPRGVYKLHGLVGLRGSAGQASFYASGYYQPQEKKWYNLSIELVSLIPVEQRPRGINRA